MRPDAALRLAGWEPAEVKLSSLYGGITNQNYRAETGGETFVLRLNGLGAKALGIDRVREGRCTRIAARLGVGPEVVRCLPRKGLLLTRFIDGLTLSPSAAGQPPQLRRVVAAIKRYHAGPRFPGTFSPFATVRRYGAIARRNGASLPKSLPEVLRRMDRIEAALARCRTPAPCHNDLLASNFIDDGRVIRIIDWEYAAMGDPMFDLGNFAANQRLPQDRCRLLLKEYFGEVRSKDFSHLNLFRLMSDLRESFWGFIQSTVSNIDFDFLSYGSTHMERFLRGTSTPQFQNWIQKATDT